jgi:putative membrane protein
MTLKRVFSLTTTILLSLTFFACGRIPNGPMGNRGYMMGYGYGGGFIWLVILVLSCIAIFFLFRIYRSKGSSGTINDTPLEVLKTRYAKGEIKQEEFEQKKKDLES